MRKTTDADRKELIAGSVTDVMAMFHVGRRSAERLGREAEATFKVGRRRLYNIDKIREYIKNISC